MMLLAEQTPKIRHQGPSPRASADVALPASARRSSGAGDLSGLHPQPLRVALLTGGGDKPYALGMAAALTSEGISIDFIGSDDLSSPELLTNSRVSFLNLRGDQNPNAKRLRKMARVLIYYWRLISSSSLTARC